MNTDSRYNIPGWVNTVFLVILGIIGWLYVEAQGDIKSSISETKTNASNNTSEIIKLKSDLENYMNYDKASQQRIEEAVKELNKKLDRLLEK